MAAATLTRVRKPIVLLLAASAVTLGLGACGKGPGDTAPAPTVPSTTPATVTQTAPTQTAAAPAPTGCRAVDAPEPRPEQRRSPPEMGLDDTKTYTATVDTSCGDFQIRLDVDGSPRTAASFAALSRDDYYDDTAFQRVSKPAGNDFVIQGGDPTGTGIGGAGYSIVEPPAGDARYTRGTVAMAKTTIEDPGTSTGQFFVVTARDAGLPPDYAILGRVVSGQGTVARIAAAETDPTTEMPLAPIVIRDIAVSTSG